MNFINNFFIIIVCVLLSLQIRVTAQVEFVNWESLEIGAEQIDEYLPMLKDKKIGVVANHTSFVNQTHLVDYLISKDCQVEKIFGLEHGFRGNQSDGELIDNNVDHKTGIKVISLYGKHKKPSLTDLQDLELIIFDIQDVGVRFYTYLTSMCYIMEACAEHGIPLIILDRPNPNGFYVDGPVLKLQHKSFIGLHSIPIVHGLTLGEYALMVVGEGWIQNSKKLDLRIIKVKGYDHNQTMELPIKPSPNLPTHQSILLYPSLALFEGTIISVGRGTPIPFEHIGHPNLKGYKYSFKPISIKGVSINPPQKDKICFGVNLSKHYIWHPERLGKINLEWITYFYKIFDLKEDFFNAYFYKLSGVSNLKEQIKAGKSVKDIRDSWSKDLDKYKKIRAKYLLYPDFK